MDREQAKKHILFWNVIIWVFLVLAFILSYFYFIDTTSTKSKWVGLFSGAIAILLASYKAVENSFCQTKEIIFEKISQYYQSGVLLYSKQLFKIAMFIVALISCCFVKLMSLSFIVSFVVGTLFALLAMFFSTFISSKSAVRSLQQRNELIYYVEKQILNSSVTISFLTVGLTIIPLVILFHITKDYQIINGYAFGVALIALINNVAYSISSWATKSADDVVCNQIAKLSRNDKRNPLLLLNGLSKNIIKTSTITLDIFAAIAIITIASMGVGDQFSLLMGTFLPIAIVSCGIFASIIAVLLSDYLKTDRLALKFLTMILSANVLFILFAFCSIKRWLPDYTDLIIPLSLGAFGGLVFCFMHFNFIFPSHRPAQNISNASISGFEQTLRQVLKEGMGGVVFPAIIIGLGIVASFVLVKGIEEPSVGLYGIMLFILGLVSTSAVLITMFVFANLVQAPENTLDYYYENTSIKKQGHFDIFDDLNTNLMAFSKNYTNLVSITVSIAALIAYSILAELIEIDIINPFVLCSLFVGSAIPYMFSSFVIRGCIKVARRLVFEVETQLRQIPQILRFEIRPDYDKALRIGSIATLAQVLIAFSVLIVLFILIGKLLNTEAIFGFVFGAILSSFGLMFLLTALFNLTMSAQKYFKSQYDYHKNQDEYDSILSNKIIFSSYEGLILPTLNVLIKFMAILAMALVPIFM
ncbi:MAG: sodium/proton-translocating pyrophosphatase [Candidatus Gastranaerophilales bacterium]|nr:sodium/proton-translocating pyrophosphatase [Candidatus Gastranaerophilales bacterium]